MKTPLLVLAMATGAALTLTPAFAQEQQREAPDFATLDADGDGQITAAELEANRAARFDTVDTDGDGALSEDELLAQAATRAQERAGEIVARMIERLDANEDGVLQQDELEEARGDRLTRRFDRVDTDDDGAISEEEFEAAQSDRGDRDGRGGKGARRGRG